MRWLRRLFWHWTAVTLGEDEQLVVFLRPQDGAVIDYESTRQGITETLKETRLENRVSVIILDGFEEAQLVKF